MRPGAASIPTADRALGTSRLIVLSAYWLSLSFQAGGWIGVAFPAQLIRFTSNGDRALVLGILGSAAGLVTTAAQPVAGALSDLSAAPWGRRRPYLLGGAAIDLAGLAIMGYAPNLTLLAAGIMVASLGLSVSGAAFQAYLPDHVPQAQYGVASGYVGAMTMIGTLASFALAGVLVAPGEAGSYYLVTAAVIAAGAVYTALAVPELDGEDRVRPRARSWRDLWIAPWRHTNFVLVFATRAMMMLALYMLFTFVEYYVRDVIHVTSFVRGAALVAGLATITAVAGGVITGALSDRIGRKLVVSVASVLMAAAFLVLAFARTLELVLGMGILFGIALGAYSAVDWALAIDVLPDRAFAAKDLGLWGISTNLPQTVAPLVGGVILAVLAPHGAALGYGALFVIAAGCSAASGVIVWRLQGLR